MIHGRPLAGWVFSVYYVPGIRWLAERVYASVAKNRYSLSGRPAHQCDACHRHSRD
jgi:predicted DCC family thiol-disulfide oxidoreductase YuxK